MAWFKVDDKLWGHPKWLSVPPRARGLWVTAGSWCAANETDGKIPRHVIAALGGNKKDADALCDAGLWREVQAGWKFHEWGIYQPDAASLKAKRKAEVDGGSWGNHRRWHEKRGIRVPECDYCQGMPPEPDSEAPLTPDEEEEMSSGTRSGGDRVTRIGPDSPPNRPVPEPDIDPDETQVGGGGHQSNARAIEPPPPPTPEVLDNLAEPWRCPNHQGIDKPCNHCKRYKSAHKQLEAERTKQAKDEARRAERREREEARAADRDIEPDDGTGAAKALAAVRAAKEQPTHNPG